MKKLLRLTKLDSVFASPSAKFCSAITSRLEYLRELHRRKTIMWSILNGMVSLLELAQALPKIAVDLAAVF